MQNNPSIIVDRSLEKVRKWSFIIITFLYGQCIKENHLDSFAFGQFF